MTLYSALASHPGAPAITDQRVFFEFTGPRKAAATHLRELLATLWCLEADRIEVVNCHDETELRLEAMTAPTSYIDARLFECGYANGQPIYDTELPLLLVRPELMNRLHRAWLALPRPEAS